MQASEKACKKYREWLSGMLECATAVVKARQHLTAAEQTLKESHDDLALYSKASPPPSFLQLCCPASLKECKSGMQVVRAAPMLGKHRCPRNPPASVPLPLEDCP